MYLGWDRRVVKVVVSKVKTLEVNKAKKATAGVRENLQYSPSAKHGFCSIH
jgi:hypothetical protein